MSEYPLWKKYITNVVSNDNSHNSHIDEEGSLHASGNQKQHAFQVSSARKKIGSWMGNNWFPPQGWKLYSTNDLQQMFSKSRTSLHFVGDSTARRAAMTMYLLLNSSSTFDIPQSILDDNFFIDGDTTYPSTCDSVPSLVNFHKFCYIMGNNTIGNNSEISILSNEKIYCLFDMSVVYKNELEKLHEYLKDPHKNEMTSFQKHARVIVVAVGTWEEGKKEVCGRYHTTSNYTEGMLNDMHRLLDILNEYQLISNKTIIWRTDGFFDITRRTDTALIKTLNRESMDAIEQYNNSGFTYVNYGAAVEPRSFQEKRIGGGHVAHYGFGARLVLLQMIVNHLVEMNVLSE